MKISIVPISFFFAAGMSMGITSSVNATQNPQSGSFLPPVRTTKILAVGHLTGRASLKELQLTMKPEVKETVKLYLEGKIDWWYMRKDKPGVVFLLNVSDTSEARRVLEGLPLGKAGLMEFDLTPLGPLAPLASLIGSDVKSK